MELDRDALVSLLMRGASAVYLHEASVLLLAHHEHWLRRPDFRRFVELYGDPPEAAGVQWDAVVTALESGRLPAGEEETAVLKIAASLAGHHAVSLYDVVQGLSRDTVKHVAEALMYADGFLESVADPRP
jgi:hypothetical protein